MPIVTVTPDATVNNNGWTIIGGAGSAHASVADASDATYIEASAPSIDRIILGLPSPTVAADEFVAAYRVRRRARLDDINPLEGSPSPKRITARLLEAFPSSVRGGVDTSYAQDVFVDEDGPWRVDVDLDDIDHWLEVVRYEGSDWQVSRLRVQYDVWEAVAGHNILDPSGTVTDTQQPTLRVNTGTLGDGTPVKWLVDADLYVDGSPDELLYNWQLRLSDLPADILLDLLGDDDIFLDNDTYEWRVRIGKPSGNRTLWSAYDTQTFTINITPPDDPLRPSVTVDTAAGKNVVSSSSRALTHDEPVAFEMQRSVDGGVSWQTVRGGYVDASEDTWPETYTFDDWDVPRGIEVSYRALQYERTVDDVVVTSDPSVEEDATHPLDGREWLYDVGTWEAVGPVTVMASGGVRRDRGEHVGVFDGIVGRDTAVVVTAGRRPTGHALRVFARAGDVDRVEQALDSTGPILWKRRDGRQVYLRRTSTVEDEIDLGSEFRRVWDVQAVTVDQGY